MRVRLRPAYPRHLLAAIYNRPHRHAEWPDHKLRVEHTISLAQALCRETGHPAGTVADLSCGDGVIARALGPASLILGDLAPGYPVTGPIEETIHRLGHVDLFVFCETAEHVDDPDHVLTLIRGHADLLVMSTPLAEFDDANDQHYWGWDADAVRDMLESAAWRPVIWSQMVMPRARFQVWGCR